MADTRQQVEFLKHDLPYYCANYIKVRPKEGGLLVPLVLNKAQMRVHQFLEDMRTREGLVRVCIIKGRQMGCSTYTAARFLHHATLFPGTSVFILAHISKSTDYLFDLVKRMYYNLPEPLRPVAERSNKKELKFGQIDSEYALGTAGAQDVGRGMNPHLLHLSEAAFYQNTDDLTTGLMQGVATAPGTEIIMESTANGVNNMFYNLCMKGTDPSAVSRYRTLFLPWYIQDEYREKPRTGFRPNAEDHELMDLYGLDLEQIFWRRRKLEDEYNGDLFKFHQEYPNSMAEAFVTSGDTLFSTESIETARKYEGVIDSAAPLILGVDGSGEGADRTALVLRQGRRIVEYKVYDEPVRPMRLAGIIAQYIDRMGVDMVFLDVAYGYGCRDRLAEMGYGAKVQTVHFGETKSLIMPDLYRNKRAEMYGFMKEWLDAGGASIPDDDLFVRDLLMIPGFKISGSRGLLALPLKEEIKKNNDGISCDLSDAAALTFAYPIAARAVRSNIIRDDPNAVRANSPFKSRRLAQSFVKQQKISELYIR